MTITGGICRILSSNKFSKTINQKCKNPLCLAKRLYIEIIESYNILRMYIIHDTKFETASAETRKLLPCKMCSFIVGTMICGFSFCVIGYIDFDKLTNALVDSCSKIF